MTSETAYCYEASEVCPTSLLRGADASKGRAGQKRKGAEWSRPRPNRLVN